MKGILFKPWKIKAIAEDDREWQTRRLGGLKEFNQEPAAWCLFRDSYTKKLFLASDKYTRDIFIKSRYQVGEVVYVKEAVQLCKNRDGSWDKETTPIYKLEISPTDLVSTACDWDWLSPLFMPEWAARYFEKITDIRAERLQEISARDCEAEGIDGRGMLDAYIKNDYRILWNSINAKWKRVWNKRLKIYEFWQFPWCEADAVPIPKTTQHPERYHSIPNPWVWVYQFKTKP